VSCQFHALASLPPAHIRFGDAEPIWTLDKNVYSCEESNPDSSLVHPVAWIPYQLSYPDSHIVLYPNIMIKGKVKLSLCLTN
jgi:hypothetical protein